MIAHILEVLIVLACASPFGVLFVRQWLRNYYQYTPVRFDRTRMASPAHAGTWEVIAPPFWDIRRQLLKRKAEGQVEMMVDDATGKPRLFVLKMVKLEDPHDICPLCKRPFKKKR